MPPFTPAPASQELNAQLWCSRPAATDDEGRTRLEVAKERVRNRIAGLQSGVGVLVMYLTALSSLRETTSTYYDRYRFAHVFAGVKRAPLHIADRIAAIPGVQVVETRVTNLALLDLEDGSGSCVNGTAAMNTSLRGTAPSADVHAVEFTLGVPFASNHGDPLTATAPLGDAAMHWHWRGGYKFMRTGVSTSTDRFWMHLGSTACEGTIRNITACGAPNRVTLRLDNFAIGDGIVVDLAGLIAGDTLEDGNPSDCSSGPAEHACTAPFAALGLTHAMGDDVDQQRVFFVKDRL